MSREAMSAMKICLQLYPVAADTFLNGRRHSRKSRRAGKCGGPSIIITRCESGQDLESKNKDKMKGGIMAWAAETIGAIPAWADETKERGMRRIKPLYTQKDWMKHRSSSRHVRHFMSSASSRVIVSLVPPVLVLTGIAAVIATYNTFVMGMGLGLGLPLLHGSSLPCQLTAPALALLLVFRTEASYSRFCQGKQLWNTVVAHCLELGRRCVAWMPPGSPLGARLLSYVMAFPLALKCHLIHGSDMRRDLGTLLPKEELLLILKSKDPPNCLIQLMSQIVEQLPLDGSKQNVLDSHISVLNETINACDALVRIPIPLSYTRLTSRFLVLWHLTLPVVLWDECNWLVVPATFVSSASLFCIEEVGVLIEEPFPMLPLENLCRVFVENIKEMIKINSLIKDGIYVEINHRK